MKALLELCDQIIAAGAKATARPWKPQEFGGNTQILGNQGTVLNNFLIYKNADDPAFIVLAANSAVPLAQMLKIAVVPFVEHVESMCACKEASCPSTKARAALDAIAAKMGVKA